MSVTAHAQTVLKEGGSLQYPNGVMYSQNGKWMLTTKLGSVATYEVGYKKLPGKRKTVFNIPGRGESSYTLKIEKGNLIIIDEKIGTWVYSTSDVNYLRVENDGSIGFYDKNDKLYKTIK